MGRQQRFEGLLELLGLLPRITRESADRVNAGNGASSSRAVSRAASRRCR